MQHTTSGCCSCTFFASNLFESTTLLVTDYPYLQKLSLKVWTLNGTGTFTTNLVKYLRMPHHLPRDITCPRPSQSKEQSAGKTLAATATSAPNCIAVLGYVVASGSKRRLCSVCHNPGHN